MDFIIRKYVFLKACPNYNAGNVMNFISAFKYLKYILLSRHSKGHGIHSPFVFDLVSRVLRNKVDPEIVCTIEKVRKKMISDNRTILVNDMGSRSGLLKTNFRKVSDIARCSPVPGKYGELLSKMAVEFGKPLIIEFGTSLGISTLYMACSCTDTKVYTIEGCHATVEIAKKNFTEAGLNNIEIFEGSFDEVLSGLKNAGIKPGLVFIDGNHRKEPVIKYFNQMAELSDNKTVIIIDDINYSNEMREAWKAIQLHEKISVTIDIFRMGIVFFRPGINHNNYIIRY
jgi:predicted O-methyltransferase YrrM